MRLRRAALPCLGAAILLVACGDAILVSSSPDGGGEPDGALRPEDAASSDGPTGLTDAARDGDAKLTLDAFVDAPFDANTDGGVDADAGPMFTFNYADVNHLLGTGQSLSVGSQGTPILTATQPYDNIMFSGGVKPSNAALTSFVDLVEGPSQETHNSSFANLVTHLAETVVFVGKPAPQNSHRLLVSIHGVGGTAYSGLKKGTAPFTAAIAQVQAAKTLTTNANQSYIVRAVTNVHGESDHVGSNVNYMQNLIDWQKDYDTDVRAITGQVERIPMLHSQISSWTKYGQATSAIPMAQLDASTSSSGAIIMVGAKYMLPYVADGVHLTNHGYRQMGEYYAKVYRHVILEGKTWEPVRPSSASLAGDTITVTFHVPVPPLVFDATLVSNPGNYGFEYTDDAGAGTPTIQQVTLDGTTAVKIKLSAAPTGQNRRVRYAFTGTGGAKAGATTGPRGNLRDSDATPSLHGYKLYNWGVHFEKSL